MTSSYQPFLLILAFTAAAHARPALHYSYTGNNPSRWTRSTLTTPDAATPTDFSAFPCGATVCSVSRVIADPAGNTYAVGSRTFTNSSDVFAAKLDPSGATVFLATFSGKGTDTGSAIALDPAGNIYIGGSTTSPNFPLRNPLLAAPVGNWTGFLMKLSPDGSQIIYSTYFAGQVYALAVDATGAVYATGQTASRDFPATPGMPNGPISGLAPGGVFGAFVAKISPAGDKIVYSGRISGSSVSCGAGSSCFLSMRYISGAAIRLDAAGNAYVAGNSNVTDLPTTPGVLSPTGIGGWVARVNAAGNKLDYLTYLGTANYVITPFANPGNTVSDLTVDAAGDAYLAGRTSDPKFPATAGAYQSKFNGPANPGPYPAPPADAFVAKLNPQGAAMVWATFLGGSGEDAATAIAIDSKGTPYVTGTTVSTDFPLTTGPQQGGDFVAVLNPTGSALTFAARFPATTVSKAITVDANGQLRLAGSAGLIHALTPAQSLPPRIFAITDITGGALGAAVAPGEMLSIFGTALSSAQIQFDGTAAQILYASDTQVNAVAPASLTPGQTTTVRIAGGTGFAAPVIPFASKMFRNGNAAAALNEDGTANSPQNPAKFGSVVAIWATGAPTGLYIDGETAQVLYAGPAPGPAGIYQINFRVPSELDAYNPQAGIGFTSASSDAYIYVKP